MVVLQVRLQQRLLAEALAAALVGALEVVVVLLDDELLAGDCDRRTGLQRCSTPLTRRRRATFEVSFDWLYNRNYITTRGFTS